MIYDHVVVINIKEKNITEIPWTWFGFKTPLSCFPIVFVHSDLEIRCIGVICGGINVVRISVWVSGK